MVSIRASRGPLLPKPVSGLDLFWLFLQQTAALDDCVHIPEGPQFWEFNVPSGKNVWYEAPYNLTNWGTIGKG